MSRPARVGIAALLGGLAALALAACSTAPLPTRPTPLPTPSAVTFTPADPDPLETFVGDAGVDFDSPDGGIHCGILGFADGRQLAGCSVDDPTYDEPDGTAADCGGGAVIDGSTDAVAVLCGDAPFAGASPDRYPAVGILPIGSSVTTLGFTCFSGDDGIACRSDATGAGFRISADSLDLF